MYSKFRVGREKIDELTSLSAFCPFVRSFSLWFDDLSMGPEGFEAVLPFFPENSSCGSKWLMHAVTEFVRISCVLTGSVVEDLLLFGTILALKSPKFTCGSEGGGGLGWAVATVPVSMSDRSFLAPRHKASPMCTCEKEQAVAGHEPTTYCYPFSTPTCWSCWSII